MLRKLNARLRRPGGPPRASTTSWSAGCRPRDPRPAPRSPVTLPPDAFDWAEEVAEPWIEWVKRPASTSSATSRTCGRSGPPATPSGATPPAAARDVSSTPPIDALVAMTSRPRAGPTPTTRDLAGRKLGRHLRAMTDASRRRPARAWGWVAHLREGGTTPWATGPDDASDAGPYLPGAQQLELLRRLNRRPARRRPRDRVLAAPAPGRGRPDLAAGRAVAEARPSARRPVDPADLSADELLRVATALLRRGRRRRAA